MHICERRFQMCTQPHNEGGANIAKTIQIPMALFDSLCGYFLTPSPDADCDADQWDRIHDQLSSELDTAILRDLREKYQRVPTEEEHGKARFAYLKAITVPELFRPVAIPFV